MSKGAASSKDDKKKLEESISYNLRDSAVLKPDIDIDNTDVVVRPQLSINRGSDEEDKPKEDKSKEEKLKKEASEDKDDSENEEKSSTKPVSDSIMELANNKDFSVATIAKEANRINRKEKGEEVFISLH